MVYNKTDFKKHIETLQIEGFKIKSAVQAFLLIRRQNDKIETITISYRDYAPHGYYIDGVSVDIYFEEIEKVLNPLYEKYKIGNRYGETTVQRALVDIEDIDYSTLQVEINNESSFNIVRQDIIKLINKGALSFFDDFNTLNEVNEEINRLDEDNLSTFISGIVGLKVPYIKKVVGDPSFTSELLRRNLFYQGEALEYPQYFKNHDKVFRDLFQFDLKLSSD